jgi:hypothetical protein
MVHLYLSILLNGFYFSNYINHSSIYPLYCSYNFVTEYRFTRFSADTLCFILQIFQRPYGKTASTDTLYKILSQRIDCNTSFCYNNIYQFARTAKGCNFINDYRYPVTEERYRQNYISCVKTILPSSYTTLPLKLRSTSVAPSIIISIMLVRFPFEW